MRRPKLAWSGRVSFPALPITLVAITIALCELGDEALRQTSTIMLVNLIVVVGLYTFSGNSGIPNFAHVGFMGVGAYVDALLTMPKEQKQSQLPNLPDLLTDTTIGTTPGLLIAGLSAGALGYLLAIPLMRLAGLAAGIATFAVLMIINVVLSQWNDVTRGTLTLIVDPVDTTLWWAFGWAAVIIVAAFAYQESRLGMRVQASREEPIAAESVGVNVRAERRRAFAVGAGMAGIGGALYAHLLGTISPDAFFLDLTILTLAMLVVGGFTSLTGSVVGAIAVSALIESFRRLEEGTALGPVDVTLPAGTQEVALAAAMLLILFLRPNGIMGGRELTLRLGQSERHSSLTSPVASREAPEQRW